MDKIEKEFNENLEIQKILEPYFIVLDGRDNEPANEIIIEIDKGIKQFINDKIKRITDEMIGEEDEYYYDEDHKGCIAVEEAMEIQNETMGEAKATGYNEHREHCIKIRDKYLK